MDAKMLLIFVSCIIGIFIIGKMFIVPLKIIFKFILNSVLGAIIIWIINLIGTIINKVDMEEYKRQRSDYDYFNDEKYVRNSRNKKKRRKGNK